MTAASPDRPKLSWKTRILFASGSAAVGVKYRTIGVLLLIFYNQVMKLPPATAALAISIVMVFDAIFDPLVAQISDNFRSPLGRRHPFLYASALPLAGSLFLLFNPPDGLSHGALFAYMLVCLLSLRFFDTLFDLPAMALVPELAVDYNERTILMGLRKAFDLSSGLIIILFAYQVFMRENLDGTGGITSREGYFGYSLLAAGVIFVSILTASIATHHMIPYLSRPPKRKIGVLAMAREMLQTVNNRPFLVLAAAMLIISIATGMRGALEIYFYLYFWQLTQAQISLLTIISVPGSLLAAAVAPAVAAKIGKRGAVMCAYGLATITTIIPPVLRLIGVLPDNGSTLVVGVVALETFITQILFVSATILTVAMLADIAEEVDVRTGRRAEGLLFCGEQMMKKMTQGIGVFAAGLILTAIHFPADAKKVGVPPEMAHGLGLLYVPTFGLVLLTGVAVLSFFNIDKQRHQQNLEFLRERALAVSHPEAVDGA